MTPLMNDNEKLQILGSWVHLVSLTSTLDLVEQWIKSGERACKRVTVSGFHGLWAGHEDASLRVVLNSAELWVPDGIAPIWIARLRGHRGFNRVTGTDVMMEFFRRADKNGYSSYFYGDTDGTLNQLRAKLELHYPGHRVVGTYSPPFRPLTPEEDEAEVCRINEARPDVLWVGLGMPKQDRWIYERRHRLNVPVAIGVGAAFAFVAETVPRCPEVIGRMGLEWVYRFMKEPRKLWRRDLLDGPRFLWHVSLELAGLRRQK